MWDPKALNPAAFAGFHQSLQDLSARGGWRKEEKGGRKRKTELMVWDSGHPMPQPLQADGTEHGHVRYGLPSHGADIICEGLGGVPRVADHVTGSPKPSDGFPGCDCILVQPVLEEAQVTKGSTAPALQSLCKFQKPIWFDAVGTGRGKMD